MQPGRGKAYPDGSVRIVASFDEETFAEVRALAVKEGTSFAEQIRQLVEEALLERADMGKTSS
jgi:acylphosphatase